MEDIGLALVIAIVPVVTGFMGFWINHKLESQRLADQRRHDREERIESGKKKRLEELQIALEGVRRGSEIAMMRLRLAANGVLPIEEVRAEFSGALAASWFRDWQTAAGNAAILASQIPDEDVRQAVQQVGYRRDLTIEALGNRAAYDQAVGELEIASRKANELIGRRIQDFDIVESLPSDTSSQMRITDLIRRYPAKSARAQIRK
jgi:hypothetical protein